MKTYIALINYLTQVQQQKEVEWLRAAKAERQAKTDLDQIGEALHVMHNQKCLKCNGMGDVVKRAGYSKVICPLCDGRGLR